MFESAKAFWRRNKKEILHKVVIYGGLAIGIAAVGYLAAQAEDDENPDVYVISEK